MVRTGILLFSVLATLFVGAIPEEAPATPVAEDHTSRQSGGGAAEAVTMAVCAPSATPCEDVFLHNAEDGSCVTNLGRACVEAVADAALRRWTIQTQTAGPHVGDTELLEVIDDHTLIVGYATGPAPPVATEVVQTDTAVTVTLVFNRPNLPPPSDDAAVATHPVLKFGRVIVTLDAPLAGRPITTATRMRGPG